MMGGQAESMAQRLLGALSSIAGTSDRLVSTLTVPGREERLTDWPEWAHPRDRKSVV